MKTKVTRYKKTLFLATLSITIIAGFGFLKVEKASADICKCFDRRGGLLGSFNYEPIGDEIEINNGSSDDCGAYCKKKYVVDYYKFGSKWFLDLNPWVSNSHGVTGAFNDAVSGPFKEVILWLLRGVLYLMGILLSVAATLFGWVINSNNLNAVIDNKIIYDIWTLVRDALNIAFILVLLFSAFATIFQVERFSWRKILPTLVIMALLVNFSFPITRFIIDFSNMLMYYFLNGLGLDGLKIFTQNAEDSKLAAILTAGNSGNYDITSLLAAIIFTFIFAVTLLVIAVLFVIRMVALAILVIFSSLAFVGSIVPFLSKYASQWWDNLFRYAFFGPIMIFMLYIAVEMMQAVTMMDRGFETLAKSSSVHPTIVAAIAFYSIPIVILWMGIAVSQSMSIAGAGAVVGRGRKFMGWAGRTLTGYRAAKWGGKKLATTVERGLGKTKYGKFLIPRVYKEASKQRAAIKDREAFDKSTGEMHDLFNKVLSRGKEKTDNAFAAHQSAVSKYAKEISDVSTNSDYVIEELKRAIENKQLAKTEAALKVLAKENNMNDMMHAIGDLYGDKVKISGPLHIKAAVRDILSQSGAGKNIDTNEFLAKALMNFSDTGIDAGNVGFAGSTTFDNTTGKFRITNDSEQATYASAKFQNFEAQMRQRILHHNSVLGEDAKGDVAEIDAVQQAMLKSFNESDLDQMNRNRADLRRQMKKAETGVGISPAAKAIFDAMKSINPHLATYADTIAKGLAKP